jgi:putative FmdB family regulatory protein
MPIYEYRCSSCGHELETLQKFADAPLVACPSCHADTLVKKVSAAGFQLKGSGWYATDFKGSGSKPVSPKADGAAEAGTGSAKDGAGTGSAKDGAGAGSAKDGAGTGSAKDGAARGDAKGGASDATKSSEKSGTKGAAEAPAAKTGGSPAAT